MTEHADKNILVIYHGGCADGFCAAWLLHKEFPKAEFHAAHYGTEPPDVTGKNVFVVDFCYKRAVMRQIAEAAKNLTVLDHHATSEADMKGFEEECRLAGIRVPNVIFRQGKSGARIVWEWLYGEKSPPVIVKMIEDRDLWLWQLPFSREINAALRSYPMTFESFNWLYEVMENGAPAM